MNRPTLEVADIIRSAGNRFIQRNRDHLCWPQLSAAGHPGLPHGSSRRPSGPVFAMRPSGHLLQFVSKPALPEMYSEANSMLD